MTKYGDGGYDVDNDGNKVRNINDNAAARSGSDLIRLLVPIRKPWSRLGITKKNRSTMVTALCARRTM